MSTVHAEMRLSLVRPSVMRLLILVDGGTTPTVTRCYLSAQTMKKAKT